MTETALRLSQEIAEKVTTEIGGLGLFGVELFVKGEQVWFSEVSPRPHDTGMVTMVTQRQTEFDLHVRAILGLPVSTTMQFLGASAVILGGIDKAAVTYTGLDKALAIPQTEIRLFAKPEAFVSRRMGVALSVADTITEARTNAVKAASLVQIQ
jgi:phosphoribosylglycinamide formyltransferase 2